MIRTLAFTRLAWLALAMALWLAPVVVALSHGPGAMEFAGADAADAIAHGHAHDDGGAPLNGHDATDHEHSSPVVLSEASTAMPEAGRERVAFQHADAASAARDGPERPPRL